MTQEKVSDKVHVAFSAWTKFCFVNYEEACVLSGFEEIFFCVQLKDVITELKTNGSDLFHYRFASFFDMAESMSFLTLDVWNIFFPFFYELVKDWWRHR